MATIRTKWGAQIAAACAGTLVPESFLAALVANESGGDAAQTRFEAGSFAEMCLVVSGKRAHFLNLGAIDLIPSLANRLDVHTHPSILLGLHQLVDYATSWGLTQIMGYQTIPFHRTLAVLTDPAEHLKFAVVLLVQFANRWDLTLGGGETPHGPLPGPDLEKLFACWNCGEPFPEKTFDPHYCANGLLRMSLYPPAAAPGIEST